jgi:hypothetical protein
MGTLPVSQFFPFRYGEAIEIGIFPTPIGITQH